jgi:MFS family permease
MINNKNISSIYKSGNVSINDLSNSKHKYIFILFGFLLLIVCLFIFNPYNIAKKYFTIITFISIFAGACLIAILLTYSKISSKDSLNDNTVRSLIYIYILNAASFILIMSIIGVLLYYIFKLYGNLQSKHSILALFINLFIVVVFLSLLYRFFDIGKYFKSSPFFQLIYSVVMYLPCLFIYLIETPMNYLVPSNATQKVNKSVKDIFNHEYTKTDTTSFILLIIMIILLLLYMFFPYLTEKIQLQGGKQITNQTIYTNKQADLFTIQQLTNMTTPDYHCGLSFWLYIDSEPPSTSNLYLSNGSVLNFADTPNILYNGIENSLIFMQKHTSAYIDVSNIAIDISMNEYGFHANDANDANPTNRKNKWRDASNNIVQFNKNASKEIFRLKNIQLQKWNHIALNLYNGTMDIFYNGDLVKSIPGVVPWVNMGDNLSIGANNGINGGVCNITFFNKPLTYGQIYYLYELFKNKTPPVTYSNLNKTVIFKPSNNPTNTNNNTYTQYGSNTNTTILTQSPAIMDSDIANSKTNTQTQSQNNGNVPTPYVMAPALVTNVLNTLS